MFDGLSLPVLLVIGAGAALVILLVGLRMTGLADRIADRTGLGEAVVGGVLLGAALLLQTAAVLRQFGPGQADTRERALSTAAGAARADVAAVATIREDLEAGTLPDAKLMGMTLMDRYGFHLQAVGLLLLVATVGVVVLSKRERATPPPA